MNAPAARPTPRCPVCGSSLKQRRGRGRPRVYCSDSCKQAAHEQRNDMKPWTERTQVSDDAFAPKEDTRTRILSPALEREIARKAERGRRAVYTNNDVLRKFCLANPSFCVEVVISDPSLCAAVLDYLSELIFEMKYPSDDPRWAACYQAILGLRSRVDFITGALPVSPVSATPTYNHGDAAQGPQDRFQASPDKHAD